MIKNVKIWEHEPEDILEPVSLPHWGAMAFQALHKAFSLEGKQLQLFQNGCALFIVGLLSPHNTCILVL